MILATEYTNDNGEPVSEFPNLGQNGYSNLYINGIMQESSLYNVSSGALTIDPGAATTAFPASFSYYNLYINAMIQTADTSTVSTTTLTIPGGDVLDPATPIIVEFVVT